MYTSDTHTYTKRFVEQLNMPVMGAAILALVAGLFMGEFIQYIITALGIIVGLVATGLLEWLADRIENFFNRIVVSITSGDTISRRLLFYVIFRKSLSTLPGYLYVFICLYFALIPESNIQTLALALTIASMKVIHLEDTAKVLDSPYDSPSLIAVVMENLVLLLICGGAAIANFFITINLNYLAAAFVTVVITGHLYAAKKHYEAFRLDEDIE